jgi:hypothetical protein
MPYRSRTGEQHVPDLEREETTRRRWPQSVEESPESYTTSRTHAIGGHLHAGPHCGGGYRLAATLLFAAPAEVSSVLRASSPGCGGQGKVSA